MFITTSARKNLDPRKYEWFVYKGRTARFNVEDGSKIEYDLTLAKGEKFGVRKFRGAYYLVDAAVLSFQLRLQSVDAERILANSKGWSGKVGKYNVSAGQGGLDKSPPKFRRIDKHGRLVLRMDSAMFRRGAYDKKKRVLYLEFRNGAVWEYKGVSPKQVLELEQAKSQGRYFNRFIKDVKDGDRIEMF